MNRLWGTFSTMSIRTRLFLLTLFVLTGSFVFMGYQLAAKIGTLIQNEALEKAKSDLQTGYEIIDIKYPGPWHVKEGKLYKGETLMNDNFEIVDTIGRLTNGNTATIFLGDTRITTNVMVDGKRAVGTKVSDIVAEKVLKEGQTYLGRANVVGYTYQSAYMPIKDSGGNIIGIWYVGAPDANERIQQLKKEMMITLTIEGAVILAVALLAVIRTYPECSGIGRRAKCFQSGNFSFGCPFG